MNITGIDVHTYMVKDLRRAIAFYRDVVRLPLAPAIGENGAEFELPDGSTFELWNPSELNRPWERGNGVMFAVPDAREAVAELRSRGVTIGDPIDSPTCLMAVGEDSEGNQLVIHQRKT
ncbi:MAG TPA: VOC family protein [Candidatus Acidoferrum sp.]|jgi:predicted enzyme related to lactoylglutathione lyase|nr:VOC family protein [Candidatus Acidoferrum sp.]